MERGHLARESGRRNGAEVHEAVDAAALTDPVEGVDDVAVIGEVDVDEVGTALAEPIDRDDLVPVRTEFADDGAPELAR